MAFPVVQSYSQNSKFNPSGNVTVTAPSGMAAGDLLIAWAISGDQSNSASGPQAPDGTWTAIQTGSATSVGSSSWWKIATSADVSAGSWTFTFTDNSNAGCINAAVIRITGADATTPINASNHAVQASTTSLSTSGISPTRQALLLALGATGIGTTTNHPTTITGFAVANSNPSWTALFDVAAGNGSSGFENTVLAASWANETGSPGSATGNCTATVDKAPTYSDIQIIGIVPAITVSPSVVTLASSIGAVIFRRLIQPSVIAFASSLGSAIASAVASTWTNKNKSSASWTNKQKS